MNPFDNQPSPRSLVEDCVQLEFKSQGQEE